MSTSDSSAAVTDLVARRRRHEQRVAELAAAPVRYVPAELLEVLHGAWGMPAELGLAPAPERHLRVVAG